jgi:acyl carrier protein
MREIKIKLYKILRSIGLERSHINLFAIFNEELKFEPFDKLCFLNSLEMRFNISIPDNDIPRLKTIGNTVDYVYKKITK